MVRLEPLSLDFTPGQPDRTEPGRAPRCRGGTVPGEEIDRIHTGRVYTHPGPGRYRSACMVAFPPNSTRNLPPLQIRASFRPESVDQKARTVEMTWTTGARVLRTPWFDDPFYEELSLNPAHVRMGRLQSGRSPFLDSHASWGRVGDVVLGVIESARLEGKEGICRVRFPSAEVDPEADKTFRKIIEGILPNVSVGYRIYRMELVEDGTGTIPVYRATDWEPYEVSCVPMGADPDAAIRSAGAGDRHESNPCIFASRQESTTMEPKITPPAPQVAPPPAADPKVEDAARAAAEAATKAELERGTAIRALVQRHGLEATLAEDLVAKRVTLEAARAAVLDQLASKSEGIRTEQHVRVEVGTEEGEKWIRGAGAWMIQKAGLSDMLRQAKAKNPDHPAYRNLEFDPGEFRGASLVDLARHYLERHGVRVGLASKMEVVKRAFQHRAGLGGLQGTSDFATLLEVTLHKVSLGAYQTTPDTWSRFCGTASLTDFRDHPRYRLGSLGVLDDLNEHGELVNKALPDGEKRTLSVGTKGNIVGLTRQVIINDDLGALLGVAMMLGRAGKLTIEKAVYTLLALNSGAGPDQSDTHPFFYSGRNNIGTASALAVAAIEADANVLAAQTDPSGNEILDLRPAILLVPKSLGGTARMINDAQYDVTSGVPANTPNRVRNLFREVVDTARLSGTRRYLFADPAVAAAVVVSFLDGQQEPMLRSEEGWRTDGVEWRVILDFGVDDFDYRGAVTNAGTP